MPISSRTPDVIEVDFSAPRSDNVVYGNGWSHPEPGHRWAMGTRSEITIRTRSSGSDCVVMIQMSPFMPPLLTASQLVEITQDGRTVFSEHLDSATIIAFKASRTRASQGEIRLAFHFPDARHPSDFGVADSRPLSWDFVRAWIAEVESDRYDPPVRCPRVFSSSRDGGLRASVSEMLGIHPSALLVKFESLGHSCDFGLVQRAFGAEPLGLLRFAGMSTLDVLRGLLNDFEGLGEPCNIEPYLPSGSGEYWILERRYSIHYHSFVAPAVGSPDQLRARESRRLPILKRKFLEDLELGEKIFVLKRPAELRSFEVLAISMALRMHGPNTLLYLENDPYSESGSIEVLSPHLFRGILDGERGGSPPTADTWLSICALAHQKKQQIDLQANCDVRDVELAGMVPAVG